MLLNQKYRDVEMLAQWLLFCVLVCVLVSPWQLSFCYCKRILPTLGGAWLG